MITIDFKRIGERLREIRIARGFTQEYVANKAGVNTSHISNIENNRARISLPTLIRVCNALETTVDYVLCNEYTNPSSAIEQEILLELQPCDAAKKEQILKIVQVLVR